MNATREFVLPSDHSLVAGHFPEHPVVPGVMQLIWCEELLAQSIGVPVAVRSWPNVKFVHLLSPGEACIVTLESVAAGIATFRIMNRAIDEFANIFF